MKKFGLLLALCSAVVTTGAFAQSKPFFYGGAGFGTTFNNVTDDLAYSSISDEKKNDTGYKIYGGYAFNQSMAIELGYYDLGKASVTGVSGGAASQDEFSQSAVAVSLVGFAPMGNGNWFLTGKIGLASLESKFDCIQACAGVPDTSKSTVGAIFGVGAGYNVSKNFTVRADWEFLGSFKSDYGISEVDSSASLLSVGAEFRF